MKTLTCTLFVSVLLCACGGTEKKTTETPVTPDTATATPVDQDPGTPTTTPDAAPDPAMIAKGAAVFAENCSTCHGDNAEGSGKSPALRGDGALASYPTEAELFEYTKRTMPKDSPGDLSDEDYKAVVAWLRQ